MINPADAQILSEFGAHIKRLREARHLTHRQVSGLCKLHSSKISRIEAGRINVTFLTILELAKAFDLPPGDIMSFKPGEPASKE